MNADQEIFEKIDAFLLGNFTPEERNAFEAEVLENPELAEALRLHLQGKYAARADAKTHLKNRFDAEFDQIKQKRTTRRVNMRRMVMSAAAVILLLIAVPWLIRSFSGQDPLSNQELYSMHFQPAHMNVRGVEAQPQVWLNAVQSYLKKDYEPAITGFEQALSDTAFKRVSEAYLYLGVSALELNQTEAALTHFDQVNPDSYYASDAQWYRALTFLKMNSTQMARPILEKMATNPRSSHGKEAKVILGSLGE